MKAIESGIVMILMININGKLRGRPNLNMVKLDVISHQSLAGISKRQLNIVKLDVIIAEMAFELRKLIIIMVAL